MTFEILAAAGEAASLVISVLFVSLPPEEHNG